MDHPTQWKMNNSVTPLYSIVSRVQNGGAFSPLILYCSFITWRLLPASSPSPPWAPGAASTGRWPPAACPGRRPACCVLSQQTGRPSGWCDPPGPDWPPGPSGDSQTFCGSPQHALRSSPFSSELSPAVSRTNLHSVRSWNYDEHEVLFYFDWFWLVLKIIIQVHDFEI